MSISLCALCNIEITEANDSKEHIIPNAIGGWRKVTKFICNNCNNQSGETWDAELAKQLAALCLYFSIVRERGDIPAQTFDTTSSGKVTLHADGFMTKATPSFKETPNERGVLVKVEARSLKEARKMLKGFKRKYPEADIENAIAEERNQYVNGALHFDLSFGGIASGRSIVKTALALAFDAKVNIQHCVRANEYLLDEKGEACFGYYYERDLVKERPIDTVFHCVSVQGDPKTKLLLGYVEYFSIYRMVVCLSTNYQGDEVSRTYAINPMTGKEVDLEINLPFKQEDLTSICRYERIPEGSMAEVAGAAIEVGHKFSLERERSKVIDNAIREAISALREKGLKDDDELSGEYLTFFSGYIADKVAAFYLHTQGEHI